MDERFIALTAGAYQNRSELEWLYSQHLLQHRPRRIVEIGVAKGGTTRLFLDLVGSEGQVLGLDISRDDVAPDVLGHPSFTMLVGNSHDPEMVSQVRKLMPECDLLLIDGDHTEFAVLADTDCYVPMVRENGLVLWHDVRLESPGGIKRIWYRRLKHEFPGATEYYTDPHNTGFGIWYKRTRPGEAAAARKAPEEVSRETDAVERARCRVEADPMNPACRLELFEAIDADPAALRAQVREALLAAIDGSRGRPEWQSERCQLVQTAAPAFSGQLTRQHKWAEVPSFVEDILDRTSGPDFAARGIECLSEGLYWASQRKRDVCGLVDDYERVYRRCLPAAGSEAEAARVRLARTLRYEQQYEAAARFCSASLAVAPEHFALAKEHAGAMLDAGQIAEAHRMLRELYERRPEDLDVLYHLVACGPGEQGLVESLRERVLAIAREGRRTYEMKPENAPSILEGLERFGFVLLKGVYTAEALSILDGWADGCCRSNAEQAVEWPLGADQRRILREQIERSGLANLVNEYLGDWFMHQDSSLKVLGGPAGYLAWRQDGRSSNSLFRYATFWIALDPCGTERSGIEIVSFPFRGFFPAGTAKAPGGGYRRSMNEDLILPETRWAPRFDPGDMLIFHKCIGHGTQILANGSGARRSIDYRLHSRTHQE